MNFKEFGWNGIFFEAPAEMRLTSEGGNAKSGYLRLEDEDFFFEVKWEPFLPKKAKSISEVAEAFIKQIEKSKKQQLKVLRKDSTHVSKHNAVYMSLKSDFEERIYLWYCVENERVFIYRFAFKTIDDASKRIMERVLDTLKCHREKSNIWSSLNLRFETPASFLLTDRKISVGRAHLLLNERKVSAFTDKSREILIEYFSMANLVFGDTYRDLDEWLKKNYLKDLKKRYRKIRFQTEENRRIMRHNMRIKHGMSTSGLTSRKTSLYTNVTWFCSGSNRIYSVTISSHITKPTLFKRKIDEDSHKNLIGELLSSFKCH